MTNNLIIRSSSAEFLIFERQTHDRGIQVRFENGDLWLTQKAIGELFNTTRNNITMHINDIYNTFEMDENSTSKKFLLVQKEGSREVKRNVQYYNLDVVISVGWWRLLWLITCRNKRLTSWKNSPDGKIIETDVVIAKNYLSKEELEQLEHIVSAFLDLAEARAKRHIPMTMEDWATRIDKFLLSDDRDILKDAGKISHEIACDKALTEFEKYRIKQDKLYKSDFDLLVEETKNNGSDMNE